jgi:hypothetical protein
MIRENVPLGRLVIDQEPLLIRFESEIFVLVSSRGYTPAVEVLTVKTKKRFYVMLGAQSICQQLEPIRKSNNGRLLGIEVWIRKEGPEQTAKYALEPA